MTETYYFSGTTKWAKVRKPDPEYNNYQVPVYLDEKSWVELRKAGLKLQTKQDEDGEYVTFRRDHVKLIKGESVTFGPPKVLILKNGEYVPFDGLIGNGSKITVMVDVYETRKGPGHRLVTVGINELVPYEDKENQGDGSWDTNKKFVPF